MLSGQMDQGMSMFGFGGQSAPGPSVEELEAGRQKAMYDKHVKVAGHFVRVFDMHDAKERKDYEKTISDLFVKVQTAKAQVWQNDRQMLRREDGSSGWFVYLEWSEFELDERAVVPVGAGSK